MPVLSRWIGADLSARAAQSLATRDTSLHDRNRYQPRTDPTVNDVKRTRMCGAPGCLGGWSVPWKSRRRPLFEEEWGCSSKCLSALVEASVRREVGGALRHWDDRAHRHRVPLGLVLLAQGWITHPQLQTALDAQRRSRQGRIGDWLSRSCGLEEERIARGLGVQWSCPVLSMDNFSPRSMALVMPKRFVAEFGMVPLRTSGSKLLYLAFEERLDPTVALGVEQMSGLRAESGLLPASQFETVRAAILAAESVPMEMRPIADRDVLVTAIVRAIEQHQPVAARLVRVHHYYWLRLWLESGAMKGDGRLPQSPVDLRDYLFLVGR
jgi:hypothetical protein